MANVSNPVQFIGGLEAAVTVVAAANTQALAVSLNTLPGGVNVLTTVPATTAVALPVTPAGTVIVVANSVATATAVFPPTAAGRIYGAGAVPAAGASVALTASGSGTFISTGSANGDYVRIV